MQQSSTCPLTGFFWLLFESHDLFQADKRIIRVYSFWNWIMDSRTYFYVLIFLQIFFLILSFYFPSKQHSLQPVHENKINYPIKQIEHWRLQKYTMVEFGVNNALNPLRFTSHQENWEDCLLFNLANFLMIKLTKASILPILLQKVLASVVKRQKKKFTWLWEGSHSYDTLVSFR